MDGKRKILILGHHDSGASKYEDYFDEIYSGPLIISEKIILSHEPGEVPWALNIHGHDHGNSAQDAWHLNRQCGWISAGQSEGYYHVRSIEED